MKARLPLTLPPTTTSLTLAPNELARLEVSGGSRPYTAASTNSTIALASVSDGVLSVAGVSIGTSPVTVTVTDAKNAKVTLPVNVTASPLPGSFELSPKVLTVAPSSTEIIAIAGGASPFTFLDLKPAIATASVKDREVRVKGVSEGLEAKLQVKDSNGVIQTALITVAAPTPSTSIDDPFTNIPTNLTLRPNTSQTFTIGGGTGPYKVVSSNPAAVTTTVRGGALILDAGVGGTATLTGTDNTGDPLPERTVRVLNTSAPLTLSSSSKTGMVGTTDTVDIAGGLPPYRSISTSTTQVGSAVINGDKLEISFTFVGGPMRVSVVDSEGSSASLDITATAVLSAMTVSPSRIVISELLSRDTKTGALLQTTIRLLFVNGKPPFKLFSSHPRLLTPIAPDEGNLVTVTTPGTKDAPVPPCVDLSTEVFITGIDASNASASTSITITDNGLCPI